MLYPFSLNLPDFLLDLPSPDARPYCNCSCCGSEIYDGRERLFCLDDDLLCEDCFLYEVMDPAHIIDVTDAKALADVLEIDWVYAENVDAEDWE